MCFLWVSEDVRQRKPYSGLLVLDKQKYEADKILSRAHPIRNLSTTISNLKHVLRDVRPEINLCSTFAFKEVNHLWDVIDPDGLDLLRVQMCFLWVSEDARQQKTLCRITRLG